MAKTCFVIMPIGDQSFDGIKISAAELKDRYNDLIKEALLRANSSLEVVRADEISAPGTITSDVITHLMHSDFVLADVTFPNPNVFYELGLRHACRLGTIIIREKNGPKTPFDIAHLRHYEYDDTPSGIKKLASELEAYFDHNIQHPNHPDNQFQELARLTRFEFPNYGDHDSTEDLQINAIVAMMQAPDLFELFLRAGSGEPVTPQEYIRAIAKYPDVAKIALQAMSRSDPSNLFKSQNLIVNRTSKRSRKRK